MATVLQSALPAFPLDECEMIDAVLGLYDQSYFKFRNFYYRYGFEADAFVISKARYATEIEVKISLADWRADLAKKKHAEHKHIKHFYYAVPEELLGRGVDTMIDPRYGIITVRWSETNGRNIASIVKSADVIDAKKASKELIIKAFKSAYYRNFTMRHEIIRLKYKVRELNKGTPMNNPRIDTLNNWLAQEIKSETDGIWAGNTNCGRRNALQEVADRIKSHSIAAPVIDINYARKHGVFEASGFAVNLQYPRNAQYWIFDDREMGGRWHVIKHSAPVEPDKNMVEKVARAITSVCHDRADMTDQEYEDKFWATYRPEAKAALSVLQAPDKAVVELIKEIKESMEFERRELKDIRADKGDMSSYGTGYSTGYIEACKFVIDTLEAPPKQQQEGV